MEEDQKDEVLEELWHIKDQLSSSCNKDIRQLVERVNKIAQEQGFEKTVEDQQNRKIAY
jgi:uncharacterized protein YihD (DUF1040 family)